MGLRRRLLLLAPLAALVSVPGALAAPGSGPTAAVAVGDSYISGEAARWQNNSVDAAPGADGTDRGKGVYGSSGACHRSDVQEVRSASLGVDERVSIACSGARTNNVFRASQGGVGQNGEKPQADQLLTVAHEKDVRLVVLSIGGNDVGFASIVTSCFTRYSSKQGPCSPETKTKLEREIPRATPLVAKAIGEVRAVMSEAGYGDGAYRLVVQTYPSVIPRASETRYAESDPQRSSNGCPFYDEDLSRGRDEAAPAIGAMVKAAAAQQPGVEVLDLIDAFQGHEVCAKTDRQATPLDTPPPAQAEWGRFLAPSAFAQGDVQELFHPNAFGQRALGTCLTLLGREAPGAFACAGGPGLAPDAVTLRRTATLAVTSAVRPRLRLSVRPARSRERAGRTCLTFAVSGSDRAIGGATVRFAGRRVRTPRGGRVTLCGRFRAGRRQATASAKNFRGVRRTFTVARR